MDRIDLREVCGVAAKQFVKENNRLPRNEETLPCLHDECSFWKNGRCLELYVCYIEQRSEVKAAEITDAEDD